MLGEPLTLMAVHAHPDVEASSTGGILARYGRAGVRTVVVTCTNGELGDSDAGIGPSDPSHDPAAVARQRRRELARSCEILGVAHLELLGYHDSGMRGWPQNDAPNAFWNAPVEGAADRLAALIDRYHPQVVVTYDENGFYGHPDHIKANVVTRAALERATGVAKLYYPAFPRSSLGRFAEAMRTAGMELPSEEETRDFGVDDSDVAAVVDCRDVVQEKFAALEAHASQSDNAFFLRLGLEVFTDLFGAESFTRPLDRTGSPVPEDDLFSGIPT